MKNRDESNHADGDKRVQSVPLEDEEGNEFVIEQQSGGKDAIKGGGEWPDPDAEPQPPASGS